MLVDCNSLNPADSAMICIPVNVNTTEIENENVPHTPENINIELVMERVYERVHNDNGSDVDENNERNGDFENNVIRKIIIMIIMMIKMMRVISMFFLLLAIFLFYINEMSIS